MSLKSYAKFTGIIVTVAAMTSLSGCATMFSDKTVSVKFKAEPSDGTELLIAGMKYPLNGEPIELSKKTKEVTFSNPNYGDFTVPLDRHVNGGWVALDIFFTPGYGVIGLIVDGSSSRWYRYPSDVKFDFTQSQAIQTGRNTGTQRKQISARSNKEQKQRG